MGRRPSFQFYPADWLGNANLMRCTHEQRGVWIDVMCLMHDSPTEYGVLRWPLKEIAQAVGCKPSTLIDLVNKKVLKGADSGTICEAFTYTPRSGRKDGPTVVLIGPQSGPIWYSSRMVRDEYVRQHAGAITRFTKQDEGDPFTSEMSSPSQRRGERQGDGSSTSTSTSTSSNDSGDPPTTDSCAQKDGVLLALPCQHGERFPVTQRELARWKDAFPAVEPIVEAKQMKFWLETNPAKLKTLRGMGKFISSWLSRAQDRSKGIGQWNRPQMSPRGPGGATRARDEYMDQNQQFFKGTHNAQT